MVDIIIVILLFLGIYLGHKRGLIMQLFYVGTMIIGLIVSMLFSTRLAYLFPSLIPIPADVTTGLEGVYAGLIIRWNLWFCGSLFINICSFIFCDSITTA